MTKKSALARFDEKYGSFELSTVVDKKSYDNLKSFLSEMYDEAEREGVKKAWDADDVLYYEIKDKIRQSAIKEVIEEISSRLNNSLNYYEAVFEIMYELKDKYGIR